MTEYWAYRYFEDPNLANEIEDEGFDAEEILEQIEAEAEAKSTNTASPEHLADPDDWETL